MNQETNEKDYSIKNYTPLGIPLEGYTFTDVLKHWFHKEIKTLENLERTMPAYLRAKNETAGIPVKKSREFEALQRWKNKAEVLYKDFFKNLDIRLEDKIQTEIIVTSFSADPKIYHHSLILLTHELRLADFLNSFLQAVALVDNILPDKVIAKYPLPEFFFKKIKKAKQ